MQRNIYFLPLVALLLAPHARAQGLCFKGAVNYAAGSSPRSVFAADLDGDGDKDLAVADYSGSNVSVLKNNRDGTIAAAVNYAAGSTPLSVSAADLDGDGDQDLVVANDGNSYVSVLRNNGDGTYALAVNYAVGHGPSKSVFAVDLDSDGDQDLAVACWDGGVSVLKNNGDGTYGLAVNYAAGGGPLSVFAADLDGDGDQDLVVANYGSGNVSVLKNNGDGTFAAPVNCTTGSGPWSVFAADLDGDGDQDLAVANYNGNNVSVLKNNGNGTYAPTVNYAVGTQPYSVFAANLDGDGKLDLAVANGNSGTVSVLKNNGDGTYASAVNYAVGSAPLSVFAADLDGDGRLDLTVANASSGDISVLINCSHSLPWPGDLNLGPDNPNRVVSHTPTFYWSYFDTIGPQVAFDVEVGTDTLWDVAEMWATGQTSSSDTSKTYGGLPLVDGSTYFWRVRVSDGTKWGDWERASFHMNSKPSTPILNAPVARGLIGANSVHLYVNNSSDAEGDAITYDFQIFADSSLTSLVASQSNIPQSTSPTGSNLFSPLSVGVVYWWRARAYDGYEYSPWSSAESFITRTGTIHVPAERPTIVLGIAEAFDGDTVLLAHGTYAEQINPLAKAIVIQGTAPVESTIVIKTADGADIVTIASGEGSGTVIEGLTIQGAVNGNGIAVTGSSPQIIGNIIKGNSASANGGGLLVASGNPTIRGNQILSNTAIGKGGGVFLGSGASATIDSNVFYFNSCTDGGGAVAKIGSGNLIVTRNVMYGNSNTDDWGGIIYTEQAPGFLIDHNTIVGNSATANRGAGIANLSPQGGQISNNIIAFNKGGYGVYVLLAGGTAPQVTYNDLWANETGTCFGVTPGSGSIAGDPLFCDPTIRDLRLASGSPGLGTGSSGSNMGALALGCTISGPQPPTITDIEIGTSSDSLHVVDHTPLLSWNFVDQYTRPHAKSQVEVGTDNEWTVSEMWQPPTINGPDTSIQYAGTALADGLTYYVRIRVATDTLWSNWLVAPFRMNSVPGAPAPLFPISGSIVLTGRPNLVVMNSTDPQNDALHYDFEVYRDSGLTMLAAYIAGVTGGPGQTGWKVDSLTAENQRHWWRVRASDGHENGPWSSVWSFWVDAYNQPPAIFNLLTPTDGAVVYDPTPTFAWNAAVDPDPGASLVYTVAVATDSAFFFKAEVSGITTTSCDWPNALTNGTKYYWRVRADDGRGGAATSAARSFRVSPPCDCSHQGDLAQNGFIDVSDVLKVIGIAFVNGTDVQDPTCPRTRGDVNNNGAVDVNDVLYLIKTAFSNGPNPANPCDP